MPVTAQFIHAIQSLGDLLAGIANPGEQRLPNEFLKPAKELGLAFLNDPKNADLKPIIRCEDNHTIFGENPDGQRLIDAMRGSGPARNKESVVYSAFRHAVVPTLRFVNADMQGKPPPNERYAAVLAQRSGFLDNSGNVIFALSAKGPAQPGTA